MSQSKEDGVLDVSLDLLVSSQVIPSENVSLGIGKEYTARVLLEH